MEPTTHHRTKPYRYSFQNSKNNARIYSYNNIKSYKNVLSRSICDLLVLSREWMGMGVAGIII
jgi:hypothetical protein